MSVIRHNIMWLLLSQGATWIVSIVAMIVVPPLLGEQLYGEFAFLTAYTAIFELVAIFGTGSFLIKSISREPASRGQFLFNALTLKLAMAVVAAAVATALGIALGFSDQRMTLLIVLSFGIILGALNNAVIAGLHGSQQMGRPAFWDVVQKLVGTVAGIAVLVAGGGVTAFAVVAVSVGFIPFIANSWAMRPELTTNPSVDPTIWRRITIGGAPFFALAGLNLLQGTIDVPMLEGLAGTEAVGWYSLALRWVSMPSLLAVVVATAFFPALSAEAASVNRAFTSMANRCLHLVALIAIPASVGIALIAGRFIDLLYGGEFREAVPIMRLLSIEIPVAGINVVIGVVILAADRQRRWVMVALIAAVFNPLTNIFAIPWATERWGNGGIGAALTTVLTEIIMLAGAIKVKPSGVFDRDLRRVVGRIVVASATMAPVVLLLRDVPLVLTVAAAGAVYVGSSLALKTVSADDLQVLRSLIARRRLSEREEPSNESGSPL